MPLWAMRSTAMVVCCIRPPPSVARIGRFTIGTMTPHSGRSPSLVRLLEVIQPPRHMALTVGSRLGHYDVWA